MRELWSLLWHGISLPLQARNGGSNRPRPFAGFTNDIRFAVRSLSRHRALTLGAVVILALGIGVTTTTFSLNTGMSRIIKRFEEPEKLAFIWGVERGWDTEPVTGQDYLEWRETANAFHDMGIYSTSTRYVTGNGEPLKIIAVHASTNLMQMIGLRAEIGRLFGPADVASSAPDVVVLTYRMWVERFAADTTVIGQSVTLNDVAHTIIGVLPKSVEFQMLWRKARVFLPLNTDPLELALSERRYQVVGRLKNDASLGEAQTQVSTIMARLAESRSGADAGFRARVQPFEDFFYSKDDKLATALAMAGVFSVLLIACVNLANFFLVKGAARQGEIAICLAVGASRWRMVRQLLTESFFLAILAGAVGVYLGRLGLGLLVSTSPQMPFLLEEVGVDAPLILFAAAAVVAAALAFGLTPALLSTRLSLSEGVKESLAGASSGRRRTKFRNWILVAQLALTVPLVVTCSLAYLHVTGIERMGLGFQRDGLLTVRIDLPTHRYRSDAEKAAFFDEALNALRGIPGIQSVASGSSFPLGAGRRTIYAPMIVQGREDEVGLARGPYGCQSISPDYFRTFEVPVLSGRDFVPGDGVADPQVAIVNEAFNNYYWPGEAALGKQLTPVPGRQGETTAVGPVTVVGVVADFGATLHGDPIGPTVFRPFGQVSATEMVFIARTATDPIIGFPQIRDAFQRLDPAVPLSQLRSSEAIVDEWLQETRVTTVTLGLLGAMALTLTIVGLYGMVAYSVSQRTYELGIRLVLGADSRAVRVSVMNSFLKVCAIGLIVGLAISVAVATVMRSQLVLLQVSWIPSVLGIVGLLTGVVVFATYIPARRATTIEPAVALRSE